MNLSTSSEVWMLVKNSYRVISIIGSSKNTLSSSDVLKSLKPANKIDKALIKEYPL